MLNGEGKEMNRRIAKKLRKEMISWKSVDSPVRHCTSSFRKAWKFASESALRRWIGNGGGELTYSDQESARNWHHTFREGYEMKGRIDRKNRIFSDVGTRDYQRCAADNMAAYIHKFGTHVRSER